MFNFDEPRYEKVVSDALALRPQIEAAVDKVCEQGYSNIFFIGCGGTWAHTLPMKYWVETTTADVDVHCEIAAEFLACPPKTFNKDSVCVFSTRTGTTPEIIEAAKLDGAGDARIFHQIILPMSRNSIAALAIFTFLWNWEDYLWPFLMITDSDKMLLSVGLKMFNGQYGTDYGGLFAATSLAIIPVIIVYMVFQKQFIAGIATGSGK